ncbi:diacylglycerol kinase [Streptomyces longispororuber]|uniref:diacylglycerol kinase n=1 Tax=Streptomyces longispororuber TaxID=68230 RepID=UPI0033D29C6F
MSASDQRDDLVVIIDPVARRADGESVRIAKDVLGAGASLKVCLPEGPEEFARALLRRGTRRPVVVGDDAALRRAVGVLHRERALGGTDLAVVPVAGVAAGVRLARGLGVPAGAVAAARAVLDGAPRRLDLLVDDRGEVVLGDVRIAVLGGGPAPVAGPAAGSAAAGERHGHAWLRTCQSLVRTLGARPGGGRGAGPARLRVEADGVTLVDLDQPVEGVSVVPGSGGLARVEVRPSSVGAGIAPVRARARSVTVAGPDFHYHCDGALAGPVRRRTWTVRPGAWSLTLPRP